MRYHVYLQTITYARKFFTNHEKNCTKNVHIFFFTFGASYIRCPRIFSAVSCINFKSSVIFLKVKKLFVFFCIHIADFLCGVDDKRIIEFGFRRMLKLFRPWSE